MVDTSGDWYIWGIWRLDAGTLLLIINSHVAPGMVGHTDEWAI